MLTQCPRCQTTYRLTREILRIADGQVRCGRCQLQFDAAARLLDEPDDAADHGGGFLRDTNMAIPPSSAAPRTWLSSATHEFDAGPGHDPGDGVDLDDVRHAGAAEDSRRDLAAGWQDEPQDGWDMVLGGDDLDGTVRDAAAQEAAAAAAAPAYGIEVDASHEEITLEGHRVEISGTYQVLDEAGHDKLETRRESFSEQWTGHELAHRGDFEPALPWRQDAAADGPSHGATEELRNAMAQAASHGDEPPPAALETSSSSQDDDDFLPPPRRRSSLLWKLLPLPLLVLLALQLVHDNRAMLARHPQLGAPLIEAYRLAGLQLQPQWDLHAYEVRQWGIVSDPAAPGTLKVRASIRNLAGFAQPYPLLKLVLEDRWGEQVRAREFEPAEYLDPGSAAQRLLAPGQQANVAIFILDPGPDAEGFHFDVCLRHGTGLLCAAELPAG